MRRRIGIALLMLGACLAPMRALAATVAQVLVEGNARVDEEAIRIHVQSRQGAPYDSATVDSDVRAIYGMGFFENVEVERRSSPEGIVLVFRVRERPLVTDVKIEGNKKVHTEDLETALKVRPRTILDNEKLRRGVLDHTQDDPGREPERDHAHLHDRRGAAGPHPAHRVRGQPGFQRLEAEAHHHHQGRVAPLSVHGRRRPQQGNAQDRYGARDGLVLRQRLHQRPRRRAAGRAQTGRPLRHHQGLGERRVLGRQDRVRR
jgi:hypothetical protein